MKNLKCKTTRFFTPLMALALPLALAGQHAEAQLTLTDYAQKAGYQLTTFATGFPISHGTGPGGIAFPWSGGVLVSDVPGNVRLFASDTDNQDANSAPIGQNYGTYGAEALSVLNGHIYMTSLAGQSILEINADGTDTGNVIASGLGGPQSMTPNPFTSHLYFADNGMLWDLDPIAKTYTAFVGDFLDDGLALSNDGTVLYANNINGQYLSGLRTSDGTEVFRSGMISGPDGIAVGTGKLSGTLFENINGGEILQVNLQTGSMIVIATGGSRGDWVTPDPYNGTLMVTQTDSIMRLIPPPGGSFTPIFKSLKVKPTHVQGGKTTTGTIKLASTGAPDVIVTLTSSNPSIAMVPATVVVPGGSKSAKFTITTTQVSSPQSVIITGTTGRKTRKVKLIVTP